MTTKDFNLVYRKAVSLMLRKMRGIYLQENPRVTDAFLAYQLMIQPNTFSRLYRGCFSASPVVLMRLYAELGPVLFDSCLEDSGLIKYLMDENPHYVHDNSPSGLAHNMVIRDFYNVPSPSDKVDVLLF